MTRLIRSYAFAAAMIVSQPGQAAPVADAHWSALARNLFPAVEAIAREKLPQADQAMLAGRRARVAACRDDLHCIVEAAQWTGPEIEQLAADAPRAILPDTRFAAPDDGVQAEVARQLIGLNSILGVYGLGTPPRYPEIDGPVTTPGSTPESLANVRYAVDLARAAERDPTAMLDPSIALSLALLDANDRGEPAAFEPIDTNFNHGANEKARSVDWARFPYTAIIIPGVGPDDLATPLSARGKLNVRLAAESFAKGDAPFVILSGANVHPRGTNNVEAVQMRQALIDRYGVPADSVVIEPYARHTTTNLRNATRRLVAMGAPLSRDTLILTNADQSRYIESAEFRDRNQSELGYQPGRIGKRLSPNALTFRPSASSLRVDPMDPLDP